LLVWVNPAFQKRTRRGGLMAKKEKKMKKMKKIVMSVFILALGLNSLVYAQDAVTDQPNQTGRKSRISAGAGLLLGGEFHTRKIDYYDDYAGYPPQFVEINTFDIGAFGFLDATYVEATFSGYLGSQKTPSDTPISMVHLNVGILGKYPFQVDKMKLFPLLGIDYAILMSSKTDGEKATGDLSRNNAIWIKAGGGFDYPLSQHVFLRGEILWGIKLKSKNEKEHDKVFLGEWDNETQEIVPVDEMGTFSYFTHGPTIKIGIGYAF
jgi:hypothetical protein